MTSPIVICDNQLIEASSIPPVYFDLPGHVPPGLYETVLYSGGSLVFWGQHLHRFLNSCDRLGLNTADAHEAFTEDRITELLSSNDLTGQRAKVRLTAFKEPQPASGSPGAAFTLLAAAWAAPKAAPASVYPVTISKSRRQRGDQSYNHKLTGRLEVELELSQARDRGFSDVILLNDRGEICETPFANLWIWIDGVLRTPPLTSPCLPGVTRDALMRAATGASIYVDDRTEITLSSLARADEIFITSSIKCFQPITSIDALPCWKPLKSPLFHARMGETLRTISF